MRIDINAIRCFFSCGTCTVSSWSRFFTSSSACFAAWIPSRRSASACFSSVLRRRFDSFRSAFLVAFSCRFASASSNIRTAAAWAAASAASCSASISWRWRVSAARASACRLASSENAVALIASKSNGSMRSASHETTLSSATVTAGTAPA